MKIKAFLLSLALLLTACTGLWGCTRYEPVALMPGYTEETEGETLPKTAEVAPIAASSEDQSESIEIESSKEPVKVKGIYLGASPCGMDDFMDRVIKRIDETELNAVVIDVKDDFGRITYDMQSVPLVNEIGAVDVKIGDIKALTDKLHEHGIYCIARVVAFRDPYIAEQRPDLALHLSDGSLFRDNKGDAWVNPYKKEVWDYLVDIGKAASDAGFDEIQFDYIRFCTERGINDVVYDENDTLGRGKTDIITEAVSYMSEKLREEGLFVSCDVFGTIIGSDIDAQSVGQDYGEMAEELDYICPMIYPSHYASGNFGLEHPDKAPYETILGALTRSKSELAWSKKEDSPQATVRPWLQSFTASYLGEGNYMEYDEAAVRAQIQAVYDAGYDEWLLWSASANYFYDGFLTPEEEAAENQQIEESRAALPPETYENAEELMNEQSGVSSTLSEELEDALENGELSESDRAILSESGDIIISETAETSLPAEGRVSEEQ